MRGDYSTAAVAQMIRLSSRRRRTGYNAVNTPTAATISDVAVHYCTEPTRRSRCSGNTGNTVILLWSVMALGGGGDDDGRGGRSLRCFRHRILIMTRRDNSDFDGERTVVSQSAAVCAFVLCRLVVTTTT